MENQPTIPSPLLIIALVLVIIIGSLSYYGSRSKIVADVTPSPSPTIEEASPSPSPISGTVSVNDVTFYRTGEEGVYSDNDEDYEPFDGACTAVIAITTNQRFKATYQSTQGSLLVASGESSSGCKDTIKVTDGIFTAE